MGGVCSRGGSVIFVYITADMLGQSQIYYFKEFPILLDKDFCQPLVTTFPLLYVLLVGLH